MIVITLRLRKSPTLSTKSLVSYLLRLEGPQLNKRVGNVVTREIQLRENMGIVDDLSRHCRASSFKSALKPYKHMQEVRQNSLSHRNDGDIAIGTRKRDILTVVAVGTSARPEYCCYTSKQPY